MLTRDSSSGRKILLTCIITGIAAALLIGSLQFFLSWHKRDVKYNTLLSDVQHYLASYFADLKATTDILQPLTINTCQQVGAELTSRAAFSLNVRAFLLIKDKKSVLLFRHWRHEYAASATGTGYRYPQRRCYGDSARHANDAQQTDNGDLVSKPIIK